MTDRQRHGARADEQGEAGARARRSTAIQRIAGNVARVGGWAIDLPDRTLTWSDELFEILDHDGPEVPNLEQGMARYLDRTRVTAAFEACAGNGTPFDLEVDMRTFAGRPITARLVGEPEHDEHGERTRVVGALQDITDQKRAAERSRASAERLALTLETISDGLFALDHDLRFTYVNRSAELTLHRDRSELLDRHIWDEFPEAVDTPVYHAYDRALHHRTTEVLEDDYYAPLDAWFDVRVYPSPEGIIAYFQDTTEQHRVREALRAREQHLVEQATLLDEAADAIIVRDLDDRITYWNRSAEELYGVPADEARGQTLRELLCPDVDQPPSMKREVLENGAWRGELTQRHRSGRRLVVESRWTLVRDDDGEPTSIMMVNTDIAERKRLEAQFLRAQRMESIGTLAGGLAHDLNNALAPIVISAGLLETVEQDPWRLDIVRTITSSAERATEMVRQILTFARGVDGRRAPVDVSKLLDDVERLANDTFLKTIHVERASDVGFWPVVGDSTQLHQVLVNLAVNARDAMPDGGTLWLAASSVVVDEAFAAANDATPGRYVRLAVRDDGEGIEPQVLDRIFEPFFTTKDQGKGTGLGLSTSEAIVRSHGGFFTVDSTVGAGTTFLVHLPADESAHELADERTDLLPAGEGEVVLVVDDERQVRSIVRQTLEQFGYDVVEAERGEEAVEVLAERRVDVALTDMMMPGMDGPSTIRALLGLRPDLPVIAFSGLRSDTNVHRAEELGVAHFLAKPFTVSSLLDTLHQALGNDRTQEGAGSS